MSAQYAGAGTSGGGSGFMGLVSAPVAPDTGTEAAITPVKSSNHLIAIAVIVAAALAFWYYKKHHKAR